MRQIKNLGKKKLKSWRPSENEMEHRKNRHGKIGAIEMLFNGQNRYI